MHLRSYIIDIIIIIIDIIIIDCLLQNVFLDFRNWKAIIQR